MSLKAQIEAILFVTAKPIKAQAIARIVNSDVQAVRQALLELVHDYEERQGGLEIADDDGYSFQVKDQYASLMNEFMPVEMSAALIRTLSAIAIKQPILQSDIIRIRGAGAYEHIKELVEKGLVAKKEEAGERSPQLSTTKKFQEYFRLTKDGKDLRNYLKKAVKKANAADVAAGQLNIPTIMPVEMEDQLNTGIYLETADMEEATTDFEPADLTAGTDLMESLTATSASGERPLDEHFPTPPQFESAVQIMPEPAKATASTDVEVANSTLSRLAQAANTREPEPLKLEEIADEPAEPGSVSEGTNKSSVQASTASRKEPPTAPMKKAKKVPDKLTELLEKQKLLERHLRRGVIENFGVSADDDSALIVNTSENQLPSVDPGNSV